MSEPAPRSDYIIVGAGSAGCTLAHRLSEAGRTVTLIEFGGSDRSVLIRMPAALSYPMNMARYDWGYMSEPEPHLGHRRLAAPRGKVIGGSSSINGMVYVRGHPEDFNHWHAAGACGWRFADVLPYFRRMETWHGGSDSVWRGRSGPLHVTRGPRDNPLHTAFTQAAGEAGYGHTDDYNGYRQEGFGPMEQTVWRGQRWSAARAYLDLARKSGRVRVVRALATRVILNARRAVGVEIVRRSATERLFAGAEVILSASAFNSPKLLLASGIGPAAALSRSGIRPVVNRPGVGANLQDHLEIYLQFAASRPVSLYRHWNLISKAWIGARWLLTRRGLGASNQFESAGFIRSCAGVPYPDIQFHFLPLAVRYDGKTALKGHGFQAHIGPMRAASRGVVSLRGPDPLLPPRIRFNYMSDAQDWEDFRAAIRLARGIFAQPAMARYVAREIAPGETAVSDAALDAAIRAHAESAYHPCGTCRMGAPGDPMAVVDPEGRVIGLTGLRVVDSSVFPRIPNGNLNAPTIMLAEKMSDHILGRPPLSPDPRPVWSAGGADPGP